MSDSGWSVEAWRGLEAIGFRRHRQLRAVLATATSYIVDDGAERVIVVRQHAGASQIVAVRNALGWRFVRDAQLAAAIAAAED